MVHPPPPEPDLGIADVGEEVLGTPCQDDTTCEGLATTNIAYGGPERRTLYITESETGCILKCELPTPVRLMYSHM